MGDSADKLLLWEEMAEQQTWKELGRAPTELKQSNDVLVSGEFLPLYLVKENKACPLHQ